MAFNGDHVYSEALGIAVCERIASGESMKSICAREDMPALSTILRWVGDERYTAFRTQYQIAKEIGLEHMAEEIVAIADEADEGQAARSKLRVEARKWVLSKQLARKYGDRTILAGDAENPLMTITPEQRTAKIQAILAVAQARQIAEPLDDVE